jgi:hypothetical protein
MIGEIQLWFVMETKEQEPSVRDKIWLHYWWLDINTTDGWLHNIDTLPLFLVY